MIRCERDQAVNGFEPLRDRLLRQPHHQVEGDVVEAGAARHRERVRGAGGGMQPAETLQFLVSERLHPVAETIDARLAEAGEPLGVTVSGFASIVISASGATLNALRQV